MVMGCRMTITREGEHSDDHTINGQGGADCHWRFLYTIKDNRAKYAVAGYAVIQTENINITVTTQSVPIIVSSNNPGIGRPDVTFNGKTVSFSQGDEYTFSCDQYRFWVKRENDGDDFKEFTAKILPR